MPSTRAAQRRRAQPESQIYPMSAPVGGWNARDSIDRMEETDAVELINWFPDEGEVKVRGGYTQASTGLGGDVELLAEYHAEGTQKFLAAANGAIWDVTNSAASKLASGFASNRWQWLNFEGEMGLVNGSDHPQVFGGSAVSKMSLTASALTTVSSFIEIGVHKSRTYFIPDSSQDFYYSAVNALGGTLTKFPLSRLGQFGGNLLTMGTWSRDDGSGADDFAVFVMTSGEVIVYQGSDPGNASNWALVGLFNLARPIARRAITKFGGELVIATEQGYYPLSVAFAGGLAKNAAVSNKISGAAREAATNHGSNFGWEAIVYEKGHWLLFNVPVTTNTTYVQHVMNTTTGSWCKFENLNARTWGIFKGELYFGGNGKVYKADSGANDDGNDIKAEAFSAYSYLGTRQFRKNIVAYQPLIAADGTVDFSFSLGSDFGEPELVSPTATRGSSGSTWDKAEWDTASWVGGLTVIKRWDCIGKIGYNFSYRFAVSVNDINVSWFATNLLQRSAGVI